jgi:hypothetical protein
MYPPRYGLLGHRPAVSFATPSWVRPGTGCGKIHPSAGRTRVPIIKHAKPFFDWIQNVMHGKISIDCFSNIFHIQEEKTCGL